MTTQPVPGPANLPPLADTTGIAAIMARGRTRGTAGKLDYAGAIPPDESWVLVAAGVATLLDVRTAEERKFVGYVPGSVHIPWAIGMATTRNPDFLAELEAKVPRDAVVLLLCRSAKRSAAAATAAARAGWAHMFNILEGFEGNLDAQQHRGTQGGWRRCGLPWVQD